MTTRHGLGAASTQTEPPNNDGACLGLIELKQVGRDLQLHLPQTRPTATKVMITAIISTFLQTLRLCVYR